MWCNYGLKFERERPTKYAIILIYVLKILLEGRDCVHVLLSNQKCSLSYLIKNLYKF